MAILFIGCSNEDENKISLSSSKVSMNFEDEYQIEATCEDKITYTSENDYHAKVSADGLITGGRVGETNILLKSDDDSKKVKVTIEPLYNVYPDPDTNFGKSTRKDIIKKYGTPEIEDGDIIGYSNYSSASPIIMFSFDESDKLSGAIVLTKYTQITALTNFLLERYFPIYVSEDTFQVLFVNAIYQEKVTMGIALELFNDDYWSTVYLPFTLIDEASAMKAKSLNNHSKFDTLANELLKRIQ